MHSATEQVMNVSELSAEIRRLRTERKMSQADLAKALRVSKSLVAGFESARLVPQADTAVNIDEIFGTGTQIQNMASEARDDRRPWMLPWVEHERRAHLLRTYQPLLVPGLLQCEPYMRAVFETGPQNRGRIEELIETRAGRQAATLGRSDPVAISAVIGQPALRHGPPDVLKAQLGHLVDLSHRSNVSLRVIPDGAGMHAGLGGPFVLASLLDGRRCAYLDDQLAGKVVTAHGDVANLELVWEAVGELALPAAQSRDMILRMIDEQQ